MLIVLAGLPAAGKTTLGRALASALDCPLLGVDQAEAAMRRANISRSEPTHHGAYLVVAAMASELLTLGHDVVIDAVNEPDIARAHWRDLAASLKVPLRFIVVVCSDSTTHRQRLAERGRDVDKYPEPTWAAVLAAQSRRPCLGRRASHDRQHEQPCEQTSTPPSATSTADPQAQLLTSAGLRCHGLVEGAAMCASMS